jgi:hypothetical protein
MKLSILKELQKNSSVKDIKLSFDWASITAATTGERLEKQLGIAPTMNRSLEKIFEASRRDSNWTHVNDNDNDSDIILLLIMLYCHSHHAYFFLIGCLV